MENREILNFGLSEIRKQLDSGSVSSTKLTELCLEQINKYDGDLGAFLWLNTEQTLEAAHAADLRLKNGESLGALDGIPVAIKDMILVKGFKACAASKILEGYEPPYDACVVEKLKNQGAVIVGKTNQDEFAMGSSNENSAYKICKNPWNKAHSPGGSSGGSAAAVSARMSFASLGTDTGGSIRQPASFCGIVGMKPSYGRVSRFGVVAFASSLDQVGPFARSVGDAALMLSAIEGFDTRDATSQKIPGHDYYKNLNVDVKGKKVGVPAEYFMAGLHDDIRQSVERSIDLLRAHGAIIEPISLPHTKYAVATYYIIATAEASSNLSRYDGIRFGPRLGDKDLQTLYGETRGKLFGTEVKRRIMLGTYVLSAGYYDAFYVKASKVRRLFANDFARAFEKVDVIISPTTPTAAFGIGDKSLDPLAMYLNDIYTISANLAGICALSLPTGKDARGLPIGVQLMAKSFDEQKLFNFGAALEAELGFDNRPSEQP